MKKILLSVGIFLTLFSYGGIVSAQTEVGKAVTDFVEGIVEDRVQGEIDDRAGLGEVKSAIPTSFGEALGMFVGDIPSPVMGQLVKEVRIKFKTPYTDTSDVYGKKNSVCHRAANSRAWDALQQIEQKAHFGPWINIAWDTITAIAGGGATISELIKDNTKAELKKLIKSAMDTHPPKPEVKTLHFDGNCKSKSVTTIDLKLKKITIVITGNCGCEVQKVGKNYKRLKEFKVRIEATIKTAIRLKKSPLFWRDPQPQVQYKVGNIRVTTQADCDSCRIPDDLVDPPEEKVGLITGFINWFTGFFDSSDSDADDTVGEPAEVVDTSTNEDVTGTVGEDDLPEELKGIKAFVDGIINTEPLDKQQAVQHSSDQDSSVGGGAASTPQSLQCGDAVSVGSRDNVATFVHRDLGTDELNFNCNNTCTSGQVCRVLPQSVRASGASCVYCASPDDDAEVEDTTPKVVPKVSCTLPSKQSWNNAMIPGFKHTVLDANRVRIENDRSYCGMDTLQEFQKTAEATIRFFGGTCSSVTTGDFVYTDIKSPCSFIAYFK